MERLVETGSGSRRERSQTRSGGQPLARSSLFWIGLWILGSVLPVLPYAQPLWANALADTPYAYLVWIPAFAFFWAAWSLTRGEAYKDDSELNVIMGVSLMLLAGALLAGGMTSWAGAFVGNSAGLLIWPLWTLALAWLMFGVGVTGRLMRPLLYLLLGWPPIYSEIVNVTNPILENLAISLMNVFAHLVPWTQTTSTYGVYLVEHGSQWFAVQISSVCSGSDSFLAMIILLPIILVLFEGTLAKKMILIAVAAVLAVAMNLLRLFILMVSGHYTGSNFTFGTLHPVLGMILFLFAIGILWLVGRAIGMRGRTVQATARLLPPGWIRAGIAATGVAVLTVLLWPIYNWSAGSFGAPVPISTDNLTTLMPQMPGYTRSTLGRFDDSSILGPGSYLQAFAYTNPQGQYTMAEEWWTYNLSALQSYGVNNCLLFHGYKVLGRQTFAIRPGVTADAFAVLLPPNQAGGPSDAYEDIAYMFAARYHGRNVYIRAEFMTPVQYQVMAHSPVTQAMPAALRDLYAPGVSGAAGVQGLDSLTALTAAQRSNLRGFDTFVRTFASSTMAGGPTAAPGSGGGNGGGGSGSGSGARTT